MKKVFYRCDESNFPHIAIPGKEYSEEDGWVILENGYCDDIGSLAFSGMKFTRIEREVFEAHGEEWFKHVPGDPMPLAEIRMLEVLWGHGEISTETDFEIRNGLGFIQCPGYWVKEENPDDDVIGWRYAQEIESTTEQESCSVIIKSNITPFKSPAAEDTERLIKIMFSEETKLASKRFEPKKLDVDEKQISFADIFLMHCRMNNLMRRALGYGGAKESHIEPILESCSQSWRVPKHVLLGDSKGLREFAQKLAEMDKEIPDVTVMNMIRSPIHTHATNESQASDLFGYIHKTIAALNEPEPKKEPKERTVSGALSADFSDKIFSGRIGWKA
jgi:hypothetical protein